MRQSAVALGVLLFVAPALAVTTPLAGGVLMPPDLDLSWPFAAGEEVHLLSGYSPSGGSSLHDGLARPSSTNDYYAMDLTLEAQPDHGRGQPVLAAASGTVLKAGWATSGWANYGQRILVELDYQADGHRYVILYAHLERLDVIEGQHVNKGDVMGALGSSCQGALSCGSFGTPHLHFAVHQDSDVGGSGSGGSYGGHAVVPELVDGAEDLAQGTTWPSHNGNSEPAAPEPACVLGDAAGAELVVEESGTCARRLGPAAYWHEDEGHGGDALWTFAIEAPAPDNSVRWTVTVGVPGEVEVLAHVPLVATSAQASYLVTLADGASVTVAVDQAAAAGTVISLATLIAPAGPLEVRLADNSGEPYVDEATAKKIAFDAVTVRRTIPGEEPPPPGEEPPPPGEGPPIAVVPGVPASGGCGCTSSDGSSGAVFALLAVLWRRRRRAGTGSLE